MSQTEVQLIKDAVIVNADVSNSAAIDVSKISGAMPLAGGTFTDDVTFTGANYNISWDKSDNSLLVNDDARIKFGTGKDLHIYHNQSNSVIREEGTGNLNIQTTGGNVEVLTNTTETSAKFISNGAVELYYDNTKRFETTGDGAEVVGAKLSLEDSSGTIISFDESGTRKAFLGIRSFAAHDGNGIMLQTSEAAPIKFAINNVVKAVLDNNGDFKPGTNNANNLGTSSVRWSDLYLADDLHLNDDGIIRFGTSGSDMLIQHTGDNNYIVRWFCF